MSPPTLTCADCGNPVPASVPVCPHCGGFQRIEGSDRSRATKAGGAPGGFRSIDLGHRRMNAADAVRRLENEVELHATSGTRYLRVIHGYGSSGSGGAIRRAIHGELARLRGQKRIAAFLGAERFTEATEEGRSFARRNPVLKNSPDWNSGNEGVTLVVLR